MKTAIITGITGQDGSYLSEFLLNKGYAVIGLVRRSSTNTLERVRHLEDNPQFTIVESDLTDPISINTIVKQYQPDEFYNLAAQSHVGTSFKQPVYTFEVNALGVLYILEAIRHSSPHTRFYQASTSEMFGSNYDYGDVGYGDVERKFQTEDTVFAPNSPYAVAKVAAHHLVRQYRVSYELYASCGILFNHESERRGEKFVTRKITKYVAGLHKYRNTLHGLKIDDNYPKLRLGNLDAMRDWGYAPDYVEGMWLMLQQDVPGDYVLATGETHSIRDFLSAAFNHIGINDWTKYVEVDPEFYRPADVEFLLGRSHKAEHQLGWKPKTTFNGLVNKMVDYDIANEKLSRPTIQEMA